MAADPEVAEQILAAEAQASGEPAEWSPPLTEWDTQTALLAEVRDRLGEVIQAVLNTIPVDKGKSRPKFRDKPFPRPVTAVDEARERAARRAALQIVDWFFPHASDN